MPRPRLFLVDGSSLMHRAYYAPGGRDPETGKAIPLALTAPDGRPTNAVYILVNMLRKLLADQQPEYIAATFDLPGPTFRSALAADYKATRPPMRPDLAEQIPLVREACEALGVSLIAGQEGYEADDVIGTVATRAVARGIEVAIVTGDKDFFQLVANDVRVYYCPRYEGVWYDEQVVRERFGVEPAHVVDVLALTGDAIDNVKGVPGIGDRGARELVTTYGSLDALLARVSELPQKRYREALIAHGESARQSRELVRIRTDVPVDFDLQEFCYHGPHRQRCFELFSALGFRSLLPDYAPTVETVARDYQIVRTRADLDALLTGLTEAGRIGLRVLTNSPVAMRAGIVGLAFATAPRRARYLPLSHTTLEAGLEVPAAEALRLISPALGDASIAKVGHDLKADALVLARHGVTLGGLALDTQVASYLLDARAPHTLEDLALERLGFKALTEEEVCGRGPKARAFDALPPEAILDYAGERADLPLQLAGPLQDALAADGLDSLYRDLELPLIPVLVEMERAGVRVDTGALAAQAERIEHELDRLSGQIFAVAGEEFNVNSPRQLADILFSKLKLPSLKRTGKTRAASTAVEVLEELAIVHDLPRLILEWRALQKLKGTYVDALPQLVHPETGRVHTSFNQAVAATGRLSSSEPNLQNIPIRTELGREIRRAFVADDGHALISADYSQIELRVLAHLSGDETLIEAFRRGEDIHDETALRVFGHDSGLDRHERRRRAKIINYALLYGKTAFTLARDIGVTQQAAQGIIDAYFGKFPAIRRFIDDTLARARGTGIVTTLFGRRRLVPELNSRNPQHRARAEREAVNLPIQGTAADILKRAMIDVDRALPRHARMILTVHDELLFEVPEAEAQATAALVRERMERAVTLAVPLTVDIGIGKNWKDAKG